MIVEIKVPKWGITMEDAEIANWFVQEGETVIEGQALAELETDKTINELTSPCSGQVISIVATVGELVVVGQVIARIEAE